MLHLTPAAAFSMGHAETPRCGPDTAPPPRTPNPCWWGRVARHRRSPEEYGPIRCRWLIREIRLVRQGKISACCQTVTKALYRKFGAPTVRQLVVERKDNGPPGFTPTSRCHTRSSKAEPGLLGNGPGSVLCMRIAEATHTRTLDESPLRVHWPTTEMPHNTVA
jgi:hypothetical protein